MPTEFRAADGARFNDEQAARYGSRISQLTEQKGFVTPQMVVEDAKKQDSPLHDYFDWNNDVAAEKWRIEQAKYLIRHIVVTIVDEEKPEIRQFFSVSATPEMKTTASKVYVTLNSVLSDKDKKEEVIAYALRELRGWTERYRQYSELRGVVKAIDAQLKRFKKKDTHA